ncbi:MAG: heavy-metal-associated domain-containing protein [Clostridia bacterium]|nr:heavy-metal-associated domain-containing protein [Clostridia bacterium]
MTRTIQVTGLMCHHCEARVQKALEAVSGVEKAVADHTAGTVIVTLTGDVANEALKKAIEDQDYTVTGIH